jgi:hypothetical protein
MQRFKVAKFWCHAYHNILLITQKNIILIGVFPFGLFPFGLPFVESQTRARDFGASILSRLALLRSTAGDKQSCTKLGISVYVGYLLLTRLQK